MIEKLDITGYKLQKSFHLFAHPNWKLCLKEEPKKEKSFLIHKKDLNTKSEVALIDKKYVLYWEMPKKIKTQIRNFEFTPEKLKIGVFRFPLSAKGNVVDLILSNPQQLNEEEKMELIDGDIVSFDTNKVEAICFDLEEIPGHELRKVKRYWRTLNLKEIDKEIKLVQDFMEMNYKKALQGTKEKILTFPDYLSILKAVLDKKITIDEATEQSKGLICGEIL